MVCRRPGIEWAVTVLHFGEKSRDSLREHCRVWDCNTNAEWTGLGSALFLTDALNSHAWLFHQKVLFKCELIHKFSFKPNQQRPSRLTQVRHHRWRRKQDPPSPKSPKETHSHENPSCLVQMRLEYLAETVFSGVLVSVQRVPGWTLLIWPLNRAPEPQCGSVLPAGRSCRSMRTPGSAWHPLYPGFMCHQAAGSGPPRQLCGREGWPERGICSQKLHGFSHGFYWNFWSYLCWAAV